MPNSTTVQLCSFKDWSANRSRLTRKRLSCRCEWTKHPRRQGCSVQQLYRKCMPLPQSSEQLAAAQTDTYGVLGASSRSRTEQPYDSGLESSVGPNFSRFTSGAATEMCGTRGTLCAILVASAFGCFDLLTDLTHMQVACAVWQQKRRPLLTCSRDGRLARRRSAQTAAAGVCWRRCRPAAGSAVQRAGRAAGDIPWGRLGSAAAGARPDLVASAPTVTTRHCN